MTPVEELHHWLQSATSRHPGIRDDLIRKAIDYLRTEVKRLEKELKLAANNVETVAIQRDKAIERAEEAEAELCHRARPRKEGGGTGNILYT